MDSNHVIHFSAEQFRVFFDNAPVGKSMTAPTGQLLRVNPAFCEMLGYTRAEMEQLSFADITHPEDLAESKACVRALLSGEQDDWRMEKRYRAKNGEYVWTHVTTRMYRDETGAPLYFLTHILDISDRKKMETELQLAKMELEQKIVDRTAELHQSNRLLDNTARLARVGGWEIDLRQNKLLWTDMVLDIHEVDRDYVPDLATAIQFYSEESVPVITEAVRAAIEEGKSFDVELQLVTAQKRKIWVRAVGQAVVEDGAVVKVVGAFQDIDARRRADDELRAYRERLEVMVAERTEKLADTVLQLKRSNEELEQFAYVASHDLQEPLRMVASYSQLLKERYAGRLDEKADKYIGYAVDGAVRMQGLINDLLHFSRVGTKGTPFVETDCNAVLEDVLLDLSKAVEKSGATVRVENLPTVVADSTQLRQLFQNLVENGIKFQGRRAPEIIVSAQRRESDWVFSVEDNGIGIDPKFHERIFVIFQRLHERGKYSGSGIGLAIAKRIVERRGGRLWVESAEHEGATFLFTLPDIAGLGRQGGNEMEDFNENRQLEG